MQHLIGSRHLTGLTAILFTLLMLWFTGCEKKAPESGVENDAADNGSAAMSERRDEPSVEGEFADVSRFTNAMPATEECCTNVGKMDDCWWEDAIADGVTCQDDGDCAWAVTGACIKDTGDTLGVCRCDPGIASHCYDPAENRFGVCMTDPENPAGESRCGPSFCNGYLKCSCFGGCEWWDQSDPLNTPSMVAEAESSSGGVNLVCCEGNYPWGGVETDGKMKIITFYGTGSCDPAASVECVNDTECDDGNPCTVDSCDVENQCHNDAAVNYSACGTDADPLDCIGPWHCIGGFCVEDTYTFSDGVTCGTDTDPTDCIDGNICQSGVCEPVLHPDGHTCGSDTDPDDCIDGNVCQSGVCEPVLHADGHVCGSDADPNDCINGNQCLSGACEPIYHPEGASCGAGPDTDTANCYEGEQCTALGACIPVNSAPGKTPCAIDTDVNPPNCWAGYCGGRNAAVTAPPWEFDTDPIGNGACEELTFGVATNDNCASAEPLGAVATGSFVQGIEETISVHGSTMCAVDDYSAAGRNCYDDNTAAAIGAGAPDVVYQFTYKPDPAATQLYAFHISVASDTGFLPAVYVVSGDDCANAATYNDCLIHPGTASGGAGYPWEFLANNTGENWNGASQACGSTQYEWCDRAGGWSYSESPTVYQFENSGAPAVTPVDSVMRAQTVVFPPSTGTDTMRTYHVIVDGRSGGGAYDITAGGTFDLTVTGRNWDNGQCERVFDDPRVYDASSFGIYNGSIENYANSSHASSNTSITCASYPCGNSWGGITTAHTGTTPNEFWPAQAFFKVSPPGTTNYCIRTEAPASNALPNPVIEVREVTERDDLCSSEYDVVAAGDGPQGITLLTASTSTFLVAVSGADQASAPCSGNCNYRLIVEPETLGNCTGPSFGKCSVEGAIDMGGRDTSAIRAGDSCLKITQFTNWDPSMTARFFKQPAGAGPDPELEYEWVWFDIDPATSPTCPEAGGSWTSQTFTAGHYKDWRSPTFSEGCGLLLNVKGNATDLYQLGWGS